MTLDQLRIFIAVAEREHVTQAATALGLTQSAVSHAIMTLETLYGLRLFDRIGRRVILTETGRIFLDEARAVQIRAQAARTRLEALGNLHEGKLQLWASQTLASYWLPARLNRFHKRFPAVALSVVISNTKEICDRILAGTIALGLVEGVPTSPSLKAMPLAKDRLLLVVGPDHDWVRTPPDVTALTDTRWVLRERGSGTRASFEAALHAWDIDPADLDILMELHSNEAIANTIASGKAATVLSASVVSGLIENGLLHEIDLPFPDRNFLLLEGITSLSPAEQAFATMLAEKN